MKRCLLLPCCLSILLAAPACASSRYMGISMIPGEAAPEVQVLARRAQAGDSERARPSGGRTAQRTAQLDLGIRFEEGNGVPQDKARAMKLYRRAASDSGGTMWVYSPSPGGGAPARVTPVDKGSRQAGLEEAERRLPKNGDNILTDSSEGEETGLRIRQLFSHLRQSPYEFEQKIAEMVLNSSQFKNIPLGHTLVEQHEILGSHSMNNWTNGALSIIVGIIGK